MCKIAWQTFWLAKIPLLAPKIPPKWGWGGHGPRAPPILVVFLEPKVAPILGVFLEPKVVFLQAKSLPNYFAHFLTKMAGKIAI